MSVWLLWCFIQIFIKVFDMFSKGHMGMLVSVLQRYVLDTVILPDFKIAVYVMFLCHCWQN